LDSLSLRKSILGIGGRYERCIWACSIHQTLVVNQSCNLALRLVLLVKEVFAVNESK